MEECPAEFSSVTGRLQDEISKRKRAEADLRKNQDLIQAILGAAQDCVFMKDRSLRYTLVNPCMEMLLRLPASQIHGRTDVDLYGEAVGRYLQALDSRAIGGEPIEAEHTRTVHGSRLTFLESRRPVWDDKGNIVGLCGISRDITDRGGVRADLITTELEYRSPAMESTLKQARLAAATDATILLTGESGAGKDYLARYIHSHSRRSAGPFQVVNCAAVSAELAESELFGHEAGAFTGAHRPKRGLVELAEGGTLLLNEFIEPSLPLQAKLLTFLDTKSFIRVGGEQTITVDIRLIGATNGDLERAVQVGDFRADLFFRLNVLSIEVPPLRKRTEDFPALVQQMALEIGQDLGLSSVPELSPLIMEKLARYAWPGNLRELRNALERAFILMRGDPTKMNDPNAWNLDSPVHYPPLKGSAARSYNERVREMKCSLIEHALRRTGGNKAAAARLLGMTRDALNRQIKTLDLEVRVSDE